MVQMRMRLVSGGVEPHSSHYRSLASDQLLRVPASCYCDGFAWFPDATSQHHQCPSSYLRCDRFTSQRKMGSAASTNPSKEREYNTLKAEEILTVTLMLPVYYIDEPVTIMDIELATISWNLVVNDTSPKYLKYKSEGLIDQPSCLSWFYVSFYERLFDVHPLSRKLFTTTVNSQGKFLVMMISACLKQLDHPERFAASMITLAEKHCERGVRSNEYGIVGDVLFYSLQKCLGSESYSEPTERAWIKIYSSMLKHIVPRALHHEKTVGVKNMSRNFTSMRALNETFWKKSQPST
jgi:hemoglobin-like flavoprotein